MKSAQVAEKLMHKMMYSVTRKLKKSVIHHHVQNGICEKSMRHKALHNHQKGYSFSFCIVLLTRMYLPVS